MLLSKSTINGGMFWILSALTMTVGNVSALVQSNVKRMLAFSSISHAGFLVMGILVLNESSISALLFTWLHIQL